MKRFSLLLLIMLALSLSMNLFAPPVSKPFNQEVLEYGSYYPDTYDHPYADPTLVDYPEEGTIKFRYYINPEFYLDSVEHADTGAILNANIDVYGAFSVRFNVGDIRAYWGNPTWQDGDVITVEIEQLTTGRMVNVQRVLTAGTSPDAYYGIHAVTLIDPPVVLYDSRPDVLDPINTTANLMAGYPVDGVYRANNWTAVGTGDPANSNWNISFSTEGVIGNLLVTSKIRRANYLDEDELFDDVQGPRSFRTYYSLDNGVSWTRHPGVNHLLPLTGEEWMNIDFELPEECYGEPNVMLQWRLLAAGGSTIATYPAESWGEIKDVVVTGEVEAPDFYSLTIEVVGEGTTDPTEGTYTFDNGTIIDLNAFPADGWEFYKWVIDGVDIETAETQVTVDADKTVEAHFVVAADPNPTVAHNPLPAHETIDIPLETDIGWTYTSQPEFTDPTGYRIKAGVDPEMNVFEEIYIPGDPGVYLIESNDLPFSLDYSTTYYWQVIPTTIEPARSDGGHEIQRTRVSERNTSLEFRGDAEDCPVWSFTTEPATPIIEVVPELTSFGNVDLNFAASKPMMIYNHGHADLEIYGITSNNAAYTVSLPDGLSYTVTIPGMDSLQVTINFTPTEVQPYNASLVIVSNDPIDGVLIKQATGNGYILSSDFEAEPLESEIPVLVQFTNQSVGDIIAYHWDFGDGNTSAEENPEHVYYQKGQYTVNLTIEDDYTTKNLVREDYINAYASPVLTTPDSLGVSFGSVYLDDYELRQILLQSTGTDSVYIHQVSFYQPDTVFSIDPEEIPGFLLPGEEEHISIFFQPPLAVTYVDTLYVHNSSENNPILKFRITGTGEYVPPAQATGVEISVEGYNAVISWDPVTENIYGTPLEADGYIVLYNETPNENDHYYYFLLYTTDLTATHFNVALFRESMFYRVVAVKFYRDEDWDVIARLESQQGEITWGEVKRRFFSARQARE